MVDVVCDPVIRREQLVSEERRNGQKKKLVDTGELEKVTRGTSILTRSQALECGKKGKAFYFELDLTEVDPEQSAQRLLELLNTPNKNGK
jgi:hypothetical protein